MDDYVAKPVTSVSLSRTLARWVVPADGDGGARALRAAAAKPGP